MKNQQLADWLELSIDRMARAGGPMGTVICESILRATATGQTELLESVLEGASRNAVAMGQPVEEMLRPLNDLKAVIYARLEEEIDPALVWGLVFTLEEIFQHGVCVASRAYVAALTEFHEAQLAESAKVYRIAEQRVFDYAAELSRANREWARLDQAKTDFISIAAHELKTPLAVVMGYVKILDDEQRDQILAQEAETIFKGIISGAERLEVIINNLLDISALETETMVLSRSRVAVGSLVKTVVEQAAAEAKGRRHQFAVEIVGQLPEIICDVQRLHQVLAHLVNNAIKYTPDGGQIRVKAGLEEGERVEDRSIKIEIRDTGIGISPEDREHIFDKFYRAGETSLHSSGRLKFKGAGPGLGLSIAKGIIEVLKGEIWVESPGYDEVNCPGSVFHIRLPMAI